MSEIRKPTFEELDGLKYFWEAKQDIECSSDFDRLEENIRVHNPEILKAWNDYKLAVKMMDIVMNNLER